MALAAPASSGTITVPFLNIELIKIDGCAMYYRLTTIKFNPSNRKSVLDFADSIREEMNELNGLIYIRIIELDEGTHVAINCYETEEALENAMPRVLEIMSKGTHLWTGAPSRVAAM